jgi:hypothetical protein
MFEIQVTVDKWRTAVIYTFYPILCNARNLVDWNHSFFRALKVNFNADFFQVCDTGRDNPQNFIVALNLNILVSSKKFFTGILNLLISLCYVVTISQELGVSSWWYIMKMKSADWLTQYIYFSRLCHHQFHVTPDEICIYIYITSVSFCVIINLVNFDFVERLLCFVSSLGILRFNVNILI